MRLLWRVCFLSINRSKSIGHVSNRELLQAGDSPGTKKPLPLYRPVTVINIKLARLQTVIVSQRFGAATITA